ncbi:MAG: hypothetical protein GY793_10725 [Proteobacteria bacterium]|nr:hypothetical protein [Pseudomonadota bacterium]
MKYARVREVAKPNRGTEGSAGVDFFIPEFDAKFKNDFKIMNAINFGVRINEAGALVIPGKNRVVIPSGVKVNIPKGKGLFVWDKGGRAVKDGLTNTAGLIDSDYQGELLVVMYNTSHSSVELKPGDKITQYVLLDVDHSEWGEESAEKLHTEVTERGTGALGSTGVKAKAEVKTEAKVPAKKVAPKKEALKKTAPKKETPKK